MAVEIPYTSDDWLQRTTARFCSSVRKSVQRPSLKRGLFPMTKAPKMLGFWSQCAKLRNQLVKMRSHVLPASWHRQRVSFQALSRTDEQDGFRVYLLFSTFWSHYCLHCLHVPISNGQIAVDLFVALLPWENIRHIRKLDWRMSQSNILQQQESTETSPRCAKGNWYPAWLEMQKTGKFRNFTSSLMGEFFPHWSIREPKKNQAKTGSVKWRDVPRRVDAVQTASQSVSWSRTAGDTLLRTNSSMQKTHHEVPLKPSHQVILWRRPWQLGASASSMTFFRGSKSLETILANADMARLATGWFWA